MREKWLNDETDINLLDYVSKFKYRIYRACEIARENLKEVQTRVFSPGDKVLVLFPIPGHTLQVRYHGPYTIESKVRLTTLPTRQIGAE